MCFYYANHSPTSVESLSQLRDQRFKHHILIATECFELKRGHLKNVSWHTTVPLEKPVHERDVGNVSSSG
ncbi:hypothetical protein PGTUg99_021728 [Puccinia graminis f. sp. tritici]|uniref:Uncharacterized protein n=1 Tax=Puccinia graminis f. sp. tritici TaxID=56615 RepID=A0A5B0RXL9_PUCGR|nr:hypothetical protein PGTUg99_021728 [Puccinia graminis f. sp. tritici]